MAKEAPATAPFNVEDLQRQLDEANRRNAELEAAAAARGNQAPTVVPPAGLSIFRTQTGAEQSLDASAVTPDRAKATTFLTEGCPACREPIRLYDFPVMMPGLPMLWPAIVFHFRTKHSSPAGILQHPLPEPPDPLDEKAMDTLITIVDDGSWGIGLGKKISIPYRQLVDRAVAAWHAGER